MREISLRINTKLHKLSSPWKQTLLTKRTHTKKKRTRINLTMMRNKGSQDARCLNEESHVDIILKFIRCRKTVLTFTVTDEHQVHTHSVGVTSRNFWKGFIQIYGNVIHSKHTTRQRLKNSAPYILQHTVCTNVQKINVHSGNITVVTESDACRCISGYG